MIRKDFPGGWYADALPSGEFAVLFSGSHLLTHLGKIPIPLPDDQPLYHRITAVGGFQIAGQGSKDGHSPTWWWSEAHGWVRQPTAIGVSPVIFDTLGHLHVSDGSVGSQGWRYVAPSGQLITGDYTYSSTFGLSEWTWLDADLYVGQSQDDHDNAWIAEITKEQQPDGTVKTIITHRLLEPGPCRFIRATRSGDNVAIAIWKPNVGAVLYWLTVAELRALPVVAQAPPKPDQPKQPEKPKTPEPKPVPVPDYSKFVRDFMEPNLVRLGSQDKTREHSFEVLNACCVELRKKDPRFGLLEKTSGGRVENRASDVFAYDLGNGTAQLLDVISDAEGEDGTPRAGWALIPVDKAGIRPIAQWRPPYPIADAPPVHPTDPTPQPAPTVDLTPFQNELAALAVKVALLEGRVDALMALPLAKRGDAVEVTGSISVGDAFGGRKVTWTGKIK